MLQMFWKSAFGGEALLLAGTLALIWGTLRLRSWWRARQLSRQDPPTEEELEEIEALRRSGSFGLSGPRSAAARHFGQYQGRGQRRGQGGARSNHEARVVDSWRHRRE